MWLVSLDTSALLELSRAKVVQTNVLHGCPLHLPVSVSLSWEKLILALQARVSVHVHLQRTSKPHPLASLLCWGPATSLYPSSTWPARVTAVVSKLVCAVLLAPHTPE